MKKNLTKKILLGLAIGGVIAVALTAPGVLMPFAKILCQKKEFQEKDKRKIAQALSYVKKNRLVVLRQEDDTITVKLTEAGKRKVKQYQLDELKIEKPSKWDNNWRIVLFDIPEKKKPAREALRHRLQLLGFVQIQKSAWACPWSCENEIQLLAELFEITPYVQFVIAEKISNDIKLRSHFGLL